MLVGEALPQPGSRAVQLWSLDSVRPLLGPGNVGCQSVQTITSKPLCICICVRECTYVKEFIFIDLFPNT